MHLEPFDILVDDNVKKDNNSSKRRSERGYGESGTLSLQDFNKIYDMTIKLGSQYQAFIPNISESGLPQNTYKVYGYRYNKDFSQPVCFHKDEETNILIHINKRTLHEYLEWDPSHFCNDFKSMCNQVFHFVKQYYDVELSEFDILEFFRICKMNRGIFLGSIYNDESPFLEFIRAKRYRLQR